MKAVILGDQTVGGTFYADGTVLFATPGFSEGKNNLATITCTNLSATSGILARVTGYIAPTK
jgi:acid phosphatase class B